MDNTALPGRRRPVLLPGLLCCVLAALPCPYLAAEDCNGNGREDRLDIAREESRDCNQDGVPDECEEERDLFFVTRERHEICSRAAAQAGRLVSEDLDGDGDEDVAAVCSGRVLSLLWNRATGASSRSRTWSSTSVRLKSSATTSTGMETLT